MEAEQVLPEEVLALPAAPSSPITWSLRRPPSEEAPAQRDRALAAKALGSALHSMSDQTSLHRTQRAVAKTQAQSSLVSPVQKLGFPRAAAPDPLLCLLLEGIGSVSAEMGAAPGSVVVRAAAAASITVAPARQSPASDAVPILPLTAASRIPAVQEALGMYPPALPQSPALISAVVAGWLRSPVLAPTPATPIPRWRAVPHSNRPRRHLA